jgi:hypothetical protein
MRGIMPAIIDQAGRPFNVDEADAISRRHTARKEFGLTQEEIVRAIRAGTLRDRLNSVFGNPFLRLLRREVEALVKKKHGSDYLMGQQAKTELARINREVRRLKTHIAALEERKSELLADLES